MYFGSVFISLDDKNRITVPSKFRKTMDELQHVDFFMCWGYDGCLFLFPKQEWMKILDEKGDIVDLYEVRVFPTTIWIDREGIVRAEHLGPLTEDLINTYLTKLSTPYQAGADAGD